MPRQGFTNRRFIRIRVVTEECGHGHQDPRRTEAALKSVGLAEGGLQGIQLAIFGKPFDSGDLMTMGLHGEHEAGTNRCSLEKDRARTAHAVLAPDMGASETSVVPEKVGKEQP